MNEKTTDALTIIDGMFGGDAEWDRLCAEESLKLRIGQMVYDMREEAGLDQGQLAERVGVGAEVIRKVEAADYDHGPVEILIRVCLTLRKKVEIDCSGQDEHAKCRVTLLSA
jgi:ribosome-binding protein aMBF1 (putative translation factor)